MNLSGIIEIVAGIIAAVVAIVIVRAWITVYNKFIYWRNKLEEKFAGIDVIMQRRMDMLPALAQIAKKYSIHEYKTLTDTIKARSIGSKSKSLNERVKAADEIENNFLKIQAVFERYPKVRADALYIKMMGHGNVTNVERKLQQFRLTYNRVVRDYNERVQRFPRSIVAKVHGFKKAEYLTLGNDINQGPQETYNPKELFKD